MKQETFHVGTKLSVMHQKRFESLSYDNRRSWNGLSSVSFEWKKPLVQVGDHGIMLVMMSKLFVNVHIVMSTRFFSGHMCTHSRTTSS